MPLPHVDQQVRKHFFISGQIQAGRDYFYRLIQPDLHPSDQWPQTPSAVFFSRLEAWAFFAIRYGVYANVRRVFNEQFFGAAEKQGGIADRLPTETAKLLLRRAELEYYDGHYASALTGCIRAEKLLRQSNGADSGREDYLLLAELEMLAARANWKLGDLYAALYGHFKALYYARRADDTIHTAMALTALSLVYLDFYDISYAQLLAGRGRQVLDEALPEGHYLRAQARSIEARTILQQREVSPAQLQQARELLATARHNFLQIYGHRPHPYRASLQHTIVLLREHDLLQQPQLRLSDLQPVGRAFQREINLRRNCYSGPCHPELAATFLRKAECLYRLSRESRKPLALVQQGLQSISVDCQPDWQERLPAQLPRSTSATVLLQGLLQRATYLWDAYQERNAAMLLPLVLDTLEHAFQLGRKIRESIASERGRLHFGNRNHAIIDLYLQVLHVIYQQQLNWPRTDETVKEAIFRVMGGSKGHNLLSRVHHSSEDFRQFPGFGISKRELRVVLEDWWSGPRTYHSIQQAYESIHHHLLPITSASQKEAGQPPAADFSLANFYRSINPEPAGLVLAYFVGRKTVFALLVGNIRQHFSFVDLQVEMRGTLSEQIQDLWRLLNTDQVPGSSAIYGSDYGSDNYRLYVTLTALYRQLVEPLELPPAERMYIIPDEQLYFVPFEMLAPAQRDEPLTFKQLDFLIKHYQISYHTSLQILHQHHYNQPHLRISLADPDFLLLNIIYDRLMHGGRFDPELYEENMQACVRQIVKILDLQPSQYQLVNNDYTSEAAALAALRGGQAGSPAIIHIFSHRYAAQVEHPAILIGHQSADSRELILLRAGSIQQSHISPQLLLLNICRGNFGELDYSEGPLSLIQAFLRAGSQNIYYLMFRLDSATARMLTEGFIERLRQGMSVVAALQATKLAIMQLDYDHSHPYFWAAPVFIGNQLMRLEGKATSANDSAR